MTLLALKVLMYECDNAHVKMFIIYNYLQEIIYKEC